MRRFVALVSIRTFPSIDTDLNLALSPELLFGKRSKMIVWPIICFVTDKGIAIGHYCDVNSYGNHYCFQIPSNVSLC